MKILLFSDSHGFIKNMIKVIEDNSDANMIIHLGDYVRDVIRTQELYPLIDFSYVRGNNDFISNVPRERIINIQGKKIFITHGHDYGVKNGYERIIQRAQLLNVDLVFFGHTHRAKELIDGNRVFVNPGSISVPIGLARPSYCIIEIDKDKCICEINTI